MMPKTSPFEPAPHTVKLAVLLAGLEVALVALSAVIGIFASSDMGAALPIGLFFLLVAASLALGIVFLWKRRRAGRSLILVWQLFAVIIGVQTALGGAVAGGIVTAAVGGALILLLFAPSTATYLEAGEGTSARS